MIRPPPRSTLFSNTTLFRSNSADLQVGLTNYMTCYCIPSSNYSYACGYYINRVLISGTSLDNSSSCSSQYIDYPVSSTTTASLVTGNSYSLSLYTNSTYMYLSAWIYYNHNGIFDAS